MDEPTDRCDCCGRLLKAARLELNSRTRQYLCPDCLADEQSCGCEDEGKSFHPATGSEESKSGDGKVHS